MRYTTPTDARYAPYLLDMVEGNHTLIAGTTGAGKSVLENSIIYAMLATKFPGNVASGNGARFVLLDPKKVELRMYKDLPHTWIYADDIVGIEKALVNVRLLIDQRLKDMQRKRQRKSSECPVYVFIDELVDLVTSARSKSIVRSIADSISIARAAGVYFVILTQAPNRKILLPEITLNTNCRCALFCNNAIESRQVIGDDSATALPAHGLGIVQQNTERYKIEIPMYHDRDIYNIINHWTKQHPVHNFFRRLRGL